MRATEAERLEAEIYDLLHRGTPGDVRFYLDRCRGARRVLELGCGSGRILTALALAGVDAVGVDVHPGRLALASERLERVPDDALGRARVVAADMRALPFGRCFDRVLLPFNGAHGLVGDRDLKCVASEAGAVLEPGGTLLLDAYRVPELPDAAELEPSGTTAEGFLTRIVEDDREIHVRETDRWDREARRIDVVYRCEVLSAGGVARVDLEIAHRYRSGAEIVEALAEAGFAKPLIHGDFDGRPATEGAPRVVVEAAVPAP